MAAAARIARGLLDLRWIPAGIHVEEHLSLQRRILDLCPDAPERLQNTPLTFGAKLKHLLSDFSLEEETEDQETVHPTARKSGCAPLTQPEESQLGYCDITTYSRNSDLPSKDMRIYLWRNLINDLQSRLQKKCLMEVVSHIEKTCAEAVTKHSNASFPLDLYSNIFVVSLSVADLVVAVYPYPVILIAIFHNGWTLGNIHCQISGFLMGLSVIGSVFNITAIAINRYCYICHSLRYDKLYNQKSTFFYLCLTWILTVIAIVPNFFVGSLQYDPRIFSCTFAQTVSSSYTITVVAVHFIVPLAIVTFCYFRIWVLVIQVKHRVRQDSKQKLTPTDLRNFLTMFVVFVLFAVCWGPLNFIGLAVAINPFQVAPKIPKWLFVLSYFMAYFNSCLNAVIYGLLNQNFRKEYKRILMALWTPRLLFVDTSKGGTEGAKSKPSPVVTNNNQADICV
ncbi:unnamed protein product [Ranitomeya imitator]|uniref:G-protein coupled receptors family 1 profile domain-containing protein n=1 Tax=Ranitomeya imitator TaxID=111125 RepID=A0ABN9LXS4_9NEOB|nr:unnamed protein product [Ranitomeya imitator]